MSQTVTQTAVAPGGRACPAALGGARRLHFMPGAPCVQRMGLMIVEVLI
jgi:hypothetical protein